MKFDWTAHAEARATGGVSVEDRVRYVSASFQDTLRAYVESMPVNAAIVRSDGDVVYVHGERGSALKVQFAYDEGSELIVATMHGAEAGRGIRLTGSHEIMDHVLDHLGRG